MIEILLQAFFFFFNVFFNVFKSKTEPTVWLASDIALIYVHLEQDNMSLVVQSPKTSAYVYFIPVRGVGVGHADSRGKFGHPIPTEAHLWSDDRLLSNRQIGGWRVPILHYQALNSLFGPQN